ncbi:MAG: DUF1194 domain-containing protein [Anaerolineae bacterium]|nr:DUF1194 domain-containing protein [Anaerolineae bacterium]
MKKICRLLLVLSVLLIGTGLSVQAQGPTVRVQLAFILDGSRSIHPTNFTLMTYGLARALNDSSIVPRDGTVEVCVVQFGCPDAEEGIREELAPIVITETTIGHIVSHIRQIEQGRGDTPTAAGIRLGTALLRGSPNFARAERQVINVATDGLPYDPAKFPDDPYDGAKADALAAGHEAQAAGIDELDAEVVGDLGQRPGQLDFFLDLVFPQPAKLVPPGGMAPGFVRIVSDFSDFAAAIDEKLASILASPTPTWTLNPTVPPSETPTPGGTVPPTLTATPGGEETGTPGPTMTQPPLSPTPGPSLTASLTPTGGPSPGVTPSSTWVPFPTGSPEPTAKPSPPGGATPTPFPGPTPAPEVPEGSSLLLLLSGLGALGGYWSWRRGRKGR